MYAFEVYLNGKRLCVAGVGGDGTLATIVHHVLGKGRNEAELSVGGLISQTQENVSWRSQRLKTGGEVRVKIIRATAVDLPKEGHQRDPKQELKAQKRYVRMMARQLGWEIRAKPTKMSGSGSRQPRG